MTDSPTHLFVYVTALGIRYTTCCVQPAMYCSKHKRFPYGDLGNTYGALFIGAIFAAVLFGLTNIQAFLYFRTHRDKGITFYKLVVIFLWILDAVHLALIVHSLYYYLVINHADVTALTELVWSFKLQILFYVLIICGVHHLYVHRIWIVSKERSRVLPIIMSIIILLATGVSFVFMWTIYMCHAFTDLFEMEWSIYMALGTTTFVDVLIASSLCYLLGTARTGFSDTDSFITRLMGYTIDTGFLTSICSVIVIVTCSMMPKSFVFLGIQFLVAKLYVNSYIALLNARYYLQPNTIDAIEPSEYHIRHGGYQLDLNIRAVQDERQQASQKSEFRHPDIDVVLPARPAQAALPRRQITMETKPRWD